MALGLFEFVLGLVVIGSVASIVQQGIKLERDKVKARNRGEDGETDRLQGVVGALHQDVAKLKDRVRVLEKLVTDDDRRLANEIERLRPTEPGLRP